MVGPGAFIPAEDSGLIARWACGSCAEAARGGRLEARGLNIRVAVNVSARQLEDKAWSQFMSALIRRRPGSCMLDIELTELPDRGTFGHRADQAVPKLGARVHLDDFGTGYSSLSQLARIPLDAIKLDASFVRGVSENPVSQALARAIVAVARTLAEGDRRGRPIRETAFSTPWAWMQRAICTPNPCRRPVHRMAGARRHLIA